MSGVRILSDAHKKWMQGRERHGKEWVGGPPLEEMYAELLDGNNYAEKDLRDSGYDYRVARARYLVLEAAVLILEVLGERRK